MRRGIRPVLSVSAAAVGAALLLGGLAACGSAGEAPTPTPTVEPTSEMPSPDPEPADPLPEEPVAPVPDGTPDERDAEAAAEYFVELYEYTLATGDLTTWEARSLDDCGFCASTAEDVSEYNASGTAYRGGAIDTERAQFVGFDEDFRIFAVEVSYTVEPAELVGADGEVLKRFDGGGGFLMLEVGYSPGAGWMLQTGGSREESVL